MLEVDEIAEMLLTQVKDACDINNWVEAHRLLSQIVNDVLKGICYSYIFEKMNPGMSIAQFLDNMLVPEEISKI